MRQQVQCMMKWIKITLPLLTISALMLRYWPNQPTYMPEKVWGIWKTADPRYADRYLDISEAVFAIGQGRQRLQVFFFRRVVMTPNGKNERYTLYYRPDERAKNPVQSLTFDYTITDEGPRIQLKHQRNIIWYRESDPPPAGALPEMALS
jgi:hypothetical protein